jgi:hypothetical protein
MESQLELIPDDEVVPPDQQESEEDLEIGQGLPKQAVLFNTDWTVETLFRQIDKGNINLDPKFQRREAWDDERRSRLIESIVCNFPIPNVVLAEEPEHRGRYVVIDGKQRLFSIFSFLKNNLPLRGLTVRPDLEGLTYGALGAKLPDLVNTIDNEPIRTVIIRNWPDEAYLYRIFYRLNSGSLPLSSQELRKALHGGRLLEYLEDFIQKSEPHQALFGERPDRRMRDVELILRFVAFEKSYENYNGNLKSFLDETVVFYDKNWDQEKSKLDAVLARYELALKTTTALFGAGAFKKWNGKEFERRMNRAVFDVMTRYFGDKQVADTAVPKIDEVVNGFKKLCESHDTFRASIERTTKTPSATNTRLKVWGEELAVIVGKKLDAVHMRLV